MGVHEIARDFNRKMTYPAAIPVVNTGSAVIRLVGNLAFAVFNLMRTLGYAAMGMSEMLQDKDPTYFKDAKEGLNEVIVNVLLCAYSIFEAIPVIGCIPAWIIFASADNGEPRGSRA